jgi:hypothetical protein
LPFSFPANFASEKLKNEKMEDKKQKNDKGMSRREMLKWLGAGTAAAAAGAYGWRYRAERTDIPRQASCRR